MKNVGARAWTSPRSSTATPLWLWPNLRLRTRGATSAPSSSALSRLSRSFSSTSFVSIPLFGIIPLCSVMCVWFFPAVAAEPPQVSLSQQKLVLKAELQTLSCHCSEYYPLDVQVCKRHWMVTWPRSVLDPPLLFRWSGGSSSPQTQSQLCPKTRASCPVIDNTATALILWHLTSPYPPQLPQELKSPVRCRIGPSAPPSPSAWWSWVHKPVCSWPLLL